jgi:hypothetical protein
MHTWLRITETEYSIGQWLINRDGYHQFNRMLSVPKLQQAMALVNMLNGGTRLAADALHIFNEAE